MGKERNPNENKPEKVGDENFNELIDKFNFWRANRLMEQMSISEISTEIKKVFTDEKYLKALSLERESSKYKKYYKFEETYFKDFVERLTQRLPKNDIKEIIGKMEEIIINMKTINRSLDVVEYLINVEKNISEDKYKEITEEIEKVIKSQLKKKNLDKLKSLIDMLVENNIIDKKEGKEIVKNIKPYFNKAQNLELMQNFLITLTEILIKKLKEKVNEEEWKEIETKKEEKFQNPEYRIIAENLEKIKEIFEKFLPKS